VSLLPKESANRLARIEAREGRPQPERWYLLVHEPEAPRGMREFVVTEGRIAAARDLSQFADKLTPEDAFGSGFLRADSDYCARLAELYAAANGFKAASMHYELRRAMVPPPPPPEPPSTLPAPAATPAPVPIVIAPETLKPEATWPVWRVTVLDGQGDQLGVLTISAARGTVLSHDGFDRVPDPATLPIPPTPPPLSITNPKPPKEVKPKTTPKPGTRPRKPGRT
jgi:hypothetical protein